MHILKYIYRWVFASKSPLLRQKPISERRKEGQKTPTKKATEKHQKEAKKHSNLVQKTSFKSHS